MQDTVELTVTIESGGGPTLVAQCRVPWEVAVPLFNAAAEHAVAQAEAEAEATNGEAIGRVEAIAETVRT